MNDNISETFIEQLNKLGMKVKYVKNRNILCYLEDALNQNKIYAIQYIISLCLYNDNIDLLNFIKESKSLLKEYAFNFIKNETSKTILQTYEIDSNIIWIIDNFPEKEYDIYKVLLEYGYDNSLDWIINRIVGYEVEILKTLNLAIEIEAYPSVIKKLWNLYKPYTDFE
jgi:hypothetical protein